MQKNLKQMLQQLTSKLQATLSGHKQGLDTHFLHTPGREELVMIYGTGLLQELGILGVLDVRGGLMNGTGYQFYRWAQVYLDPLPTAAELQAAFTHPEYPNSHRLGDGSPETLSRAAQLATEALHCGILNLKDRRYDSDFRLIERPAAAVD